MFLVMTIDENIPGKIHHLGPDREMAEVAFCKALRARIHDWNEYTREDMEKILDRGHELIAQGTGSVCLVDTAQWTSDCSIIEQLESRCVKLTESS